MKAKNLDIIYQGDCKTILSDQSKFPDKCVDLIFTSPPYAYRRKKSYGGIHPDMYVEWFKPISKELFRILKPNGSFILNIKENVWKGERQTYVLELILTLKEQGWLWVEEYCWYKKNSYPGKWPNRFRDSWERCLHLSKQKKFKMYQESVKVPIGEWGKSRFKSMTENDFIRYTSSTGSGLGRNVSNWLGKQKVYPHNVLVFEKEHYIEPSNVIELPTVCHNKSHSAVFPIELPIWFMKLFTRKEDIVLDPFMGSGTTAIASILLGRKFIGAEIIKYFIDEANKNILDLKKELSKKS